MTPLEHLESLTLAGYTVELSHAADRSYGADGRPMFHAKARRCVDDELHIQRGRAETLAEAIEQAAQPQRASRP
jgi:hypothetical protein